MLFSSLKCSFDVLVFTETWIVEEKGKFSEFNDYTPVHLIRPICDDIVFKDKGGGIFLFL